MRPFQLSALFLFVACFMVQPLMADEIERTFEAKLHDWHVIDSVDGPVTLHRLRLDPKEGRLNKSTFARPHNQEFLETIQIQLEYTNESSQSWDARITLRWLDAEGRVIDGVSANEKLDKKSARKTTGLSISTLKYGMEVAETLEVNVHYKP